MRLLTRYLFKQFSKNFTLILAGFVGVYLLVDFFARIDNFMEKKLPFSLAAKYFLCKIPLMVEQLLPVVIMLAGVITVGLLHQNRELLGLQAAGNSLAKIIWPTVLAAVVFTIFGLASSQWILPATQVSVDRIWYQKVNHQASAGILRRGLIFYKGRGGFYTVGRPRGSNQNVFEPFSYVSWDKSYGFKQLITARQGKWTGKQWLLTDGTSESGNNSGTFRVKPFAKQLVSLPEGPKVLLLPPYLAEEQSLSELYNEARTQPEMQGRNALQDLAEKLSYLTLGIPLLLIGLPLLLVICRNQRRDLSIAIPASCLLAFMVWGIWGVLQSLAAASRVHLWVAAWLIHAVVISSAILFIRRLART